MVSMNLGDAAVLSGMAPSGTEIDAINMGSDQKSDAETELLVPATSQTVSNAVVRINVLVPFAILLLPRARYLPTTTGGRLKTCHILRRFARGSDLNQA